MKEVKKRWLPFFNKLLSFFLVLLGFSSCDASDSPDMYGSPPADFAFKLSVLDEQEQPIEGIRVDVKMNNKEYPIVMRSGLTNKQGVYEDLIGDWDINVVCTDVDGDKNGSFKKDSIQAKVSDTEDHKLNLIVKLKNEE